MNTFTLLSVEPTIEREIKSPNQLRNCRKKLSHKEEKYKSNPSQDLSDEIKKLSISIKEWESRGEGVSTKKKKIKRKEKTNEIEYLNQECKKVKKIKNILKNRKLQINKLMKKTPNPYWRKKLYVIFPESHRRSILTLFMIYNRSDSVVSIIPFEVFIYLIENNIQWYDLSRLKNIVASKGYI